MPRLSDEELRAVPHQLRGWAVVAGALEKHFSFSTFGNAIAFVNRVADLAEDLDHYPRIAVVEGIVTLTCQTPDEGGATERDVYLARRIDTLLWR